MRAEEERDRRPASTATASALDDGRRRPRRRPRRRWPPSSAGSPRPPAPPPTGAKAWPGWPARSRARRSRVEAGEAEVGRLTPALDEARERAARAQAEFTTLETQVAGLDRRVDPLDDHILLRGAGDRRHRADKRRVRRVGQVDDPHAGRRAACRVVRPGSPSPDVGEAFVRPDIGVVTR